ncbi:MAG: hypothetical protein K1X86_07290 [Ignavibacteria bacterium]|nr:hypothetical protein [Ignavibacteria bacterium]
MKKEIVKFVEASSNEDKLQFVYESLKNEDESDFWDQLTPEQQARILKAEKQCDNGEGIENEVVMRKLAEWISK